MTECINLGRTACLAGLIHDMGKFSNKFCDYITRASKGEMVKKGSVIHTFAAVRYLMKYYHENQSVDDYPYSFLTAEILSSAVGGHHGLFDCFDNNKEEKWSFNYKKNRQSKYDDNAISSFFTEVADEKELERLFHEAVNEIKDKCKVIGDMAESQAESDFFLALLTRLITSSVIDSDRLDTSSFMNPGQYFKPITVDDKLWETVLDNLNSYISTFTQDSTIKKARSELSDKCYEFASNQSGIYKLNLPTGAGKTLSGLRFALRHAEKNNKERIFFISPLLTILEQNAEEIRKAIKNDALILEHHSDVAFESKTDEEINSYELLTDTWNSPIVITTLVQFLNTLFSGKTTSVRRFHALVNSVIVIDEVQTVPLKMLSLFNTAINFLAKACNTTVVLCSATEPEFSSNIIDHPLLPCKQIVPIDEIKKYGPVFKRNIITYKGKKQISEIPELISELLMRYRSVLVVCNKKDEANELMSETENMCENRYHLSAGMCPEHRKCVLSEIKSKLDADNHVLCISTQIIEAGVDISFDAVIRFCAGMDSIVQSAGRCNRNGENGCYSPVWIVDLENENLNHLDEIADGKDATESLIQAFEDNAGDFDNDLSSEKAIRKYYEKLYCKQNKDAFDFVKDGKNIYDLLSSNMEFASVKGYEQYCLHQAFKTGGELFEVFDTGQRSVIVPWNDGENIINELLTKSGHLNKKEIDKAKRYAVSLYGYQFDSLYKVHAIHEIMADEAGRMKIFTLEREYYDDITGITKEEGKESCRLLMV